MRGARGIHALEIHNDCPDGFGSTGYCINRKPKSERSTDLIGVGCTKECDTTNVQSIASTFHFPNTISHPSSGLSLTFSTVPGNRGFQFSKLRKLNKAIQQVPIRAIVERTKSTLVIIGVSAIYLSI
jgi:hypothetical protein